MPWWGVGGGQRAGVTDHKVFEFSKDELVSVTGWAASHTRPTLAGQGGRPVQPCRAYFLSSCHRPSFAEKDFNNDLGIAASELLTEGGVGWGAAGGAGGRGRCVVGGGAAGAGGGMSACVHMCALGGVVLHTWVLVLVRWSRCGHAWCW